MSRTFLALVLVCAVAPAPLPAQEAAPSAPLDAAAFMAGCWQGSMGPGRFIEEYYTTPSANLVQGMTRYVRDGTTVDYEFTLIEADGDRTRLRPHPKGQAAVAFAETERGPGRLVWENLDHDFPQRISYEALSVDSLVARIDGTTSSGARSMEWGMARVPCPGTGSL